MLIGAMETSHILNLVGLMLSKVIENKKASNENELSDYERSLNGVPKCDSESMGRANRKYLQKLYPYLSELFLRNEGEEARDLLKKALGRDGRLNIKNLPKSPPPDYYEDEESQASWEIAGREFDFDDVDRLM